MASNDQILAALAKMSDSIADLRVQVSAIPEIKERTDELVRAIKGHNGHDGLITRMTVQELTLGKHLEDAERMKFGIEDIKQSFANHEAMTSQDVIVELKEHVKKQNDRVIEEAREISKEDRAEMRDVNKDSRKFRYDLALAILLLIANLVLNIIHKFTISGLAP